MQCNMDHGELSLSPDQIFHAPCGLVKKIGSGHVHYELWVINVGVNYQ